jgi:SPP1 family predicted phage head-tail adaptor
MAAKLLNPGDLRHRLVIEDMLPIIDSHGEHIGTGWVEVAKVWGHVAPLSARELIEAQSMQSEVRARITIRPNAAVTATCRILHRGLIYNIAGIVPDPNSGIEWLTLPVTQGLNQG